MSLRREPERLVAPATAVPLLDARRGISPWLSVVSMVLVLAGIAFFLLRFGQPAVRIEYQYLGSYDRPQFTYCRYYALDGWHETERRSGIDQVLSCPPFILVPITFY